MNSAPQHYQIPESAPRIRLDQWLQRQLEGISRTELQRWMKSGRVLVDGEEAVPGVRIQPGMTIQVDPPEARQTDTPTAENLPLELLYEDEEVLAVNKLPGQVVHPAPGHPGGTVLNAVLHAFPDVSGTGARERPGLVHRLDAETSGILLFARTPHALEHLQEQFKSRTTEKVYVCICRGIPHPIAQEVNRPIGRHPVHRQKRCVDGTGAKPALTSFRMLQGLAQGEASLLEVKIHTGRTHQIRVHLDSVQHPVLGDPVYGGRRTTLPAPWPKPPRLLLHARELAFTHPRTSERIRLSCPPPPDFEQILQALS